MSRVSIKPEMLRWARERAGRSVEDMSKRFKKFPLWETGEVQPTFKQLEDFAKATYVPFGYLFLPKPPIETLPIPDFRTVADKNLRHPSPDLLDTIYTMQRRQAWLREERLEYEAEPLDFVGSANLSDEPDAIGREMRRLVDFEDRWAAEVSTWQEAVNVLRGTTEELGIMTVINGVVGNSTNRILNVEEFRGFALIDTYAPVIFINGADAKSAQMFTFAHELAHIWLGESALSDSGPATLPSQRIESWCNRAAAEFLVPAAELKAYWQNIRHEKEPFNKVARHFKVSPIVAGRRAMDLRLVDKSTFFDFYETHIKKEQGKGPSGGDFYNNQNTRVGKMFATEVIRAAMEGRVGFREAYSLTGLNGGSFQEYARRLGFDLP